MSGWLAGLLADMAPRRRQIVKLKPEYYDKYKEVHAAVWPEVLRQIKACNIVDCGFPTSMRSLTFPRPALGKLFLAPRTRVIRGRKQPGQQPLACCWPPNLQLLL